MDSPNDAGKVFVLGLDGCAWHLLRPMIDLGWLPTLAHLIKVGTHGTLDSITPPVTAPAWASFQTGVNPGKHGLFDFNQYQPGSYDTTFATSNDIRQKTIWQIVSEHGRNILAVNVPMTYPCKPVSGCVIGGIESPGLRTYPTDLRNEILQAVPDYRVLTTQATYYHEGLQPFVQELRTTERNRALAMKHLILNKPWDLGMLHIQSTDVMQHAVYDLLCPGQPEFDESAYSIVGNLYRQIDTSLGELLSLLPADTLIIILSDHGFGPVRKTFYPNRWLAHHNWQRFRLIEPVASTLVSLLRRAIQVAGGGRGHFGPPLRRGRTLQALQNSLIDWRKTRAFMVNGWTYAQLYLNIGGREARGTVDVSERNALLMELEKALYRLEDDETGDYIVAKVYRREEIFHGPYADMGADLLIEFRPGYEATASIFSPNRRVFRQTRPRAGNTGNHAREGIYMLAGPGIQEGIEARRASLLDVFPTVLYGLGLPIPKYVDGQVISQAFTRQHWENKPPQSTDEEFDSQVDSLEQAYTSSEAEVIERRLRELGYL